MRLHAHGIDHGVGASPAGLLADRRQELAFGLLEVAQIEDVDAPLAHPFEPIGDQVDPDHRAHAAMAGDPAAHVPDRAEPQHDEAAALRHVRVLDRLVGRRQHVGEVDEAVVRRPVRHLDRSVLGLRHPQQLGLSTRHLAVQLGVPEQRRSRSLLADLGGLALGLKALVAHEAVTARDVERDDDTVTGPERRDLGTHLFHHAHRFVAEDVAGGHERRQHLVQVQVRSTDTGRRDADDGIRRGFDRRVRNCLHPDVTLAVPDHCSHDGHLPANGGP